MYSRVQLFGRAVDKGLIANAPTSYYECTKSVHGRLHQQEYEPLFICV